MGEPNIREYLNQRFLTAFGVGLVVIAIAVAWILYMQRGSHIEPVGKILKVRTLAMDENSAVAVIDFRIQNTADFPIVVREVTVTLQEPNGTTDDGSSVAAFPARTTSTSMPACSPTPLLRRRHESELTGWRGDAPHHSVVPTVL